MTLAPVFTIQAALSSDPLGAKGWNQTLEPPPPKIAAHPKTKPKSYHPPAFGNA